jgi:TIR domain
MSFLRWMDAQSDLRAVVGGLLLLSFLAVIGYLAQPLSAPKRSETARAPEPPQEWAPKRWEPAPQQNPHRSSLDEALNKLVSGNIAFNTPDHVRVGKSQIIEAKLSVNLPADVLIAQLRAAGAKESASMQVADRMIATLSGGSAFDVSPSGPQQQLISQQQMTSWTWLVTAKQPGTQYLILSFDAVLSVDGKEGTRNFNTFTKKIEVEVGWPETPGEWFALLKGSKEGVENISWLWATIFVPLGALVLWLWNKIRKKPSPLTKISALSSGTKIFLTYASDDKPIAESMAFSLRARGYTVFFDRDDLPPGQSFDQQIERAINDSDFYIFVISADSVAEGRYTLLS